MDTDDELVNTDRPIEEYRKMRQSKVLDSTTTPLFLYHTSTIELSVELDLDAILYCTRQHSAV